MEEVLCLLPVLAVAILMNIATGMYYNIGKMNQNFDYKILIVGVIKAAIIAFTFIGTAYCFDVTDLSSIGVSPMLVMNAAIILYVGKALNSLIKILGVTSLTNGKNEAENK